LDNVVQGMQHQFASGSEILGLRTFLEDWRKFNERAAKSVSLIGDYYKILSFIGADQVDANTSTGAARLGALARFSTVLADFEHVNRRARFLEENGKRTFRGGRDRGKEYFTALHRYLIHYAQDAYEDWSGDELATIDAVDILTVHQAKGLEWPIVFLPALTHGRFPSRFAGQHQDWLLDDSVFPDAVRQRYEGGDSDERRLFYVALTRARECVYLTRFEKTAIKIAKASAYFSQVTAGFDAAPISVPLPNVDIAGSREEVPLDVSFSEVSVFEDCGYRYRLATVLGFQQELALELGYGKAIHHVLRSLAEIAQDRGEVPDANTLDELLDREFYLPFANAPAFVRMLASARRLVRQYVESYSSDLDRVWAIERPFELSLPEGRVSGRADIILDKEGGKDAALSIVDYKVSNDPAYDERYRRQLAVYTAAARGEGLNVRAGYLHELNDGTRHAVDVGQHASAQAVVQLSSAVKAIRSGKYLPVPTPSKCGTCDYRMICSHSCHT
jgi:DNA helicase II / ATP-dependent DNA helicase PcrA